MTDHPRLAVVGLGYVGLPLAQAACQVSIPVVGFDTSPATVKRLAQAESHVDDISDDDVEAMLASGFTPTTDPERLQACNTYVICVPTPLSTEGGPDLTAVVAAATTIASALSRGDLVVLESTTYPGTTEEVVAPILERSGLTAGADFHLAFSPERIDPGNPVYGFRNTPKVVGGMDEASTKAASAFYALICDQVIEATGTREAEMAKLLENTYRHVNIALVNEMLKFCHELDIDLWDAIRCAATKPFGFQAFYPGPGVGGHCIPIDPNYLSHRVRTQLGQPFRFVELAQEINASMPAYVARRVQDLLNEEGKAVRGSRILLLGVTYKANIADQRESPAKPVAVALREMGADLAYWDPYVDEWFTPAAVRRTEVLLQGECDFDCVVLLQPHRELDLAAMASWGVPILDTRGVLPEATHL